MITLVAFLVMASLAAAQVPQMPYTFTSRPINASQTKIFVLSTEMIGVSYLTVERATGNPYGSNGAMVYIDQEGMRVTSDSAGAINVQRGVNGTRVRTHGALAKVWVATSRYFGIQNPVGRCNPFQIVARPDVVVPSGSAFDCVSPGLTWADSAFPWSVGKFSWNQEEDRGLWVRVPVEQGTWRVAQMSWANAAFPWNQIAK